MESGTVTGLISATVFTVILSWIISLKDKRYHGIARFFSFESIAVMTILNAKYWFADPFSVLQVLSWIFLAASIPFVLIPLSILLSKGKPAGIVGFEDTSRLVTSGIYRYIRHPMYIALIVLGFGVFLKNITPVTVSAVIINTIAAYITALIEQREMTAKFGDEYREYMKKTKMFIPYII